MNKHEQDFLKFVYLLPNNARIQIFKLANDLVIPEIIFDDPTDNTGLWTEELIEDNGDLIAHQRPHLTTAIKNIQTRMQNRRTKVRNQDNDLTDEQVEEMSEQGLGNRQLKWFCVYCWQRYQVKSCHSSKICKQGRVLRRLATCSHHNNGEQMPPAAEEPAVLD